MKAFTFDQNLPLSDPSCVREINLPDPVPGENDLLVRLEAVSINPVDGKLRGLPSETPRILGFDGVGIITDVGASVEGFSTGDRVFYAGDITRSGSHAELQCVDHRIAAVAPASITPIEAAALPLTALTAYEGLFDRLQIDRDGSHEGKTILLIGGAGGVGSMAIQLAKLAGLQVIATASRSESEDWCRELGTDAVINHNESFHEQLQELGFSQVDYIANFADTDRYWAQMGECIAPQGKLLLIVEPSGALPLGDPLKRKSVSICWEFMFTRSAFATSDQARQGDILRDITKLIDSEKLRTTLTTNLDAMTCESLRTAHQMIETGATLGKIGLTAS